jgi:opacity protein-like surface antigen
MSRKLLAVAAFALVAPIAMAQAQLKFGIGAGASSPNGDLKEGVDMGYHLMATAGFQPPLAPIGFRVDGAFNEFNFKAPVSDTKQRIMSLTANGVFSMPGAIVLSPYAIGGIGMYSSSISPKPTGFENSNDFGWNIGAGVKFGLAGFGAFGELRFHNIMADDGAGGTQNVRYIPITFGIMF